jgi:hypothetical protein
LSWFSALHSFNTRLESIDIDDRPFIVFPAAEGAVQPASGRVALFRGDPGFVATEIPAVIEQRSDEFLPTPRR